MGDVETDCEGTAAGEDVETDCEGSAAGEVETDYEGSAREEVETDYEGSARGKWRQATRKQQREQVGPINHLEPSSHQNQLEAVGIKWDEVRGKAAYRSLKRDFTDSYHIFDSLIYNYTLSRTNYRPNPA